MRHLATFLGLAIALTGCSLVGSESYDDLAPGTFRLSADDREFEGVAVYHRLENRPLARASVSLFDDGDQVMQIRTDAFLTAEVGETINAFAYFGGTYQSESGEVEITAVGPDVIEGRFRFRLRDAGNGPIEGSKITARGGFRAVLGEGAEA